MGYYFFVSVWLFLTYYTSWNKQTNKKNNKKYALLLPFIYSHYTNFLDSIFNKFPFTIDSGLPAFIRFNMYFFQTPVACFPRLDKFSKHQDRPEFSQVMFLQNSRENEGIRFSSSCKAEV